MPRRAEIKKFSAPPDPLVAARYDVDTFSGAARRGLAHFSLTAVERDELLTIMGGRGATERLLASNKRLRMQSAVILVHEFSKLRCQWSCIPNRRYWNVSFLGPLINEYRPELDVYAYRQVVDRLLRSQKLNALLSIELQALTNYPQEGEGRNFLLNGHALAWTDAPDFIAADAQAAMRASESLWSELGGDTVTFTERTDAAGGLEYLGHYLTKAPRQGKRRCKDSERPGRWHLEPVGNVRSDLQLRLMEILSQLELTDLVWGVKDGAFVRRAWKVALVDWNQARCRRRRTPLDANFDTAQLWRRVRSRPGNGSRLYHPPQFFGLRPRPLPTEKLPRQGGRRLWPRRPETKSSMKSPELCLRDFIEEIRKGGLKDL